MTDSDALREQVAQALICERNRRLAPVSMDAALADADAVLAVLPEWEKVGLLRDDRSMFVTATAALRDAQPEGWTPVYALSSGRHDRSGSAVNGPSTKGEDDGNGTTVPPADDWREWRDDGDPVG